MVTSIGQPVLIEPRAIAKIPNETGLAQTLALKDVHSWVIGFGKPIGAVGIYLQSLTGHPWSF